MTSADQIALALVTLSLAGPRHCFHHAEVRVGIGCGDPSCVFGSAALDLVGMLDRLLDRHIGRQEKCWSVLPWPPPVGARPGNCRPNTVDR